MADVGNVIEKFVGKWRAGVRPSFSTSMQEWRAKSGTYFIEMRYGCAAPLSGLLRWWTDEMRLPFPWCLVLLLWIFCFTVAQTYVYYQLPIILIYIMIQRELLLVKNLGLWM